MSDVDKIKQEIADTKASLGAKIDSLESQARDLISPAAQIEKHPFFYLGLSLGAGLLVGSQMKNGKKLVEPIAMGIFKVAAAEIGRRYLDSHATSPTGEFPDANPREVAPLLDPQPDLL